MKKKLLTLSLFATLLFPSLAFTAPSPINLPSLEPIEVEIERPIASLHPDTEFQEGGQLYLCFEGDLNSLQRSHYAFIDGEVRSNPVPLNAFIADNGTRSIAINNNFAHVNSKIKNTSEGISLFNTKIRAQDTGEQGGSSNRIIASEGEKIPYIDYISAGRDIKPCDKNRVKYGEISISKDFDWLVVQLFTIEPEASPAPAPEVIQAPVDPVLPENNAAPQSGGCSMTTAVGGFNYALSSLFALILGAHTLLRFRKQ